MRSRTAQCDLAVSPVVGMILVLAISVVGITTVLVWGLPAIQEMKASVEHQAIVTEFHEFEADLKELAKATASKTAKVWRFSQSQGDFSIQSAAERWILSVDAKSTRGHTYNMTAWHLDDTDNKFVLVNNGASPATLPIDVKADILDASSTIPLRVRYLGTSPTDACPGTGSGYITPPLSIAGGTGSPSVGGPRVFCLYNQDDTPLVLKDRMVQILVTHHATVASDRETAAIFWIADVGRAQWKLATASGTRETYVSNGVVMQGTNGKLLIDSDPTITPPSEQGGSWRFFGRLVSVNGSASLGGQARIDVLLNLYGSRALADELPATAVKFWTYGALEGTWDAYFLAKDYKFKNPRETSSGAPSTLRYLEYKPPAETSPPGPGTVKAIFHHSVVTAKG